jgi:pimeloyl-ACP methyl ester carboxylesterase
MPTLTRGIDVVPVKRGPRYYLFLLLLFVWGISFLLAASTALARLSLLAFLAAGLLLYLGLVLRNVYRSINPVRTPILQNPFTQLGVDFEDVVFPSRDGWMLSGWFIPPQNGATVILTHGMGGNRLDLMHIASVLAERGFGLLMYDMRAHGRTTGNLGTWGWLEVNDLNGAADYLLTRPEVDQNRIGALGFSLGGQITIRAVAENNSIKAIIAEDPSPAILADHPMPTEFSIRKLINYPALWMVYRLQCAASGVSAPAGVLESIGEIAPRPTLLISSGAGRGQEIIRIYFDSAGKPKELWEVPETGHGWIFTVRPEVYQDKVCGFFERWLVGEEEIEYT